MSFTIPLSITLAAADTGLTIKASLSADGTTPLSGSTDIGSFVELPPIRSSDGTITFRKYSRPDAPIPDTFVGYVIFHLSDVDTDTNFDNVTVLQALEINPREHENADIKTSSLNTGTGASGSINIRASEPKKVITDEGTVQERDIDEIIAADRYQAAKDAPDAPLHGLKISRCKPAGP